MRDDTQAFPRSSEGNTHHVNVEGMTLRQWYAGQALTGILARIPPDFTINQARVAEEALAVANAMIIEIDE